MNDEWINGLIDFVTEVREFGRATRSIPALTPDMSPKCFIRKASRNLGESNETRSS